MKFRKNRHLFPLLTWTALCSLFFGTIILGLERFPAGDFTAQFHTFGMFQAREFAQGRLPLWLPATYGGVRFVGDPQAAVFYLPRFLSILVSSPWNFPLIALELEAIAHIWLAGLFTYALAFSITRQTLAALLAAVLFGLGGYLTSYPILQLAILETVAWLPLILFLLREGVNRNRVEGQPLRPGWFVGAGLVLALSLTAGHPQTFVHVGSVAALYYLFLTVRARYTWKWVLGLGGLIFVIAIAASAAMWLPGIATWTSSTRSEVGYGFVSSGLPLLNYLQSLLPATLSFWSPEYLSLAAIALFLLAWLGRGEQLKEQRAEIYFWTFLALGAAWLALGDKGVLFQLVYRFAPGFSLFRQQERLLSIVSISGSILAAHGLAYWLSLDSVSRLQKMKPIALFITVGLLVGAGILFMTGAMAAENWPAIFIRQLGLALILFILLASTFRPKLQASALILLVAVDLFISTYSGIARLPESPANYWQRPEWLETMLVDYRAAGVSRIASGTTFYGNLGAVYDWEDLSGISPIRPAALAELDKLPQARRWQLLNVSHVLRSEIPKDLPLTSLVNIDGDLDPDHHHYGTVYRLESSLARAWMSYRPVQVSDRAAALTLLGDPTFDPATQVIFHTPVPETEGAAPVSGNMASPTVTVSRPRPGQLDIAVETGTAGFLVISEWLEPGWRARIDGERSPIYPADFALQALFLPAGGHEVNLIFRPVEVDIGLALSFLTLVGATLLAWRWRPVLSLRATTPPAAKPARQLPAFLDIRFRRPPGKRFWLWAMLLLMLFGFALRVFRIDHQELRGDEAFSYLFASQPVADIIPDLINEGDPHSPLHYLSLHGWMTLAGDSELALRFIPLLAGLLVVPLMFQLGRKINDRALGLLLAFLSAIAPSLIWISQDVRNQYVVVMALSLLATVLLLRLVRRPTWIAQVVYILSCALIIYAHYYGIFVLLGHGFYVFLSSESGRIRLVWLADMVVAGLLFLPWAIAIAPATLAAGQLSDPSQPELARHIVAVGSELAAGPVWPLGIARWLFVGLILLALFGFIQLWVRNKPLATLLLVWLVGTIMGLYLIRFRRATFNNFYITIAAPAWWALAGSGFYYLWAGKQAWSRLIVLIGLIVLVGFAAIGLARYYFQPEYSRSLGYRSIAQQIAQERQANDLFLAHFPDPSFDYYMRDIPLPRTMQPATFPADEQVTNENMAGLAAKYDRLWFVPAHKSNWDPEDSVFRWLDYHTLLEQEVQYDRLLLAAYRPVSHLAEVMTQVDQTAGEALSLDLAYLTINGQPQPIMGQEPLKIEPGAALEVSLLWQATGEISQDYTVFSHILDENGQIVAQHDGTPATGTRPTSSWLFEESILDKHPITIPESLAPGRGRLVVGLYDANFDRLTFSDGAEFLVLSDVIFTPAGPE